MYIGTNQKRCVDGTCTNQTLRDSGCFMCSNEHGGDERCVTCIEDHIVYDGTCVGCLSMEDCPFNNSDEIDCVDEHDAVNCSDYVCVKQKRLKTPLFIRIEESKTHFKPLFSLTPNHFIIIYLMILGLP